MNTPTKGRTLLATASLILSLTTIPARQACAQGGVPLWTNYYHGPWAGGDYATRMALDDSGNVFVTGCSTGSSGGCDYVTIKYSGAGVPLWTNRYDGLGNNDDYVSGIAVDVGGNVLVTGYSYNGANDDYVTVKYSDAGLPLWTNRYNGPGNYYDYASAIAVDGNGNVLVTGYSCSTGSGNSYDYATIKYSAGGVPLWTNRYNGPGNTYDEAWAMAVDTNGNAVVTGYSTGSAGIRDCATIKYSSAGLPVWSNHYHGTANGDDFGQAAAVDTSGNVLVTGGSQASGSSRDDYVTLKYSGAGVPLWTNRYSGPANGSDVADAVAVDASGNVFVTGYSASSVLYPYNEDYATVAYSGAGVPLWTNRYHGRDNGDDGGNAVAVDSSGNVFVAGSAGTIAYSGAGVPLWTNSSLFASAIAVDASGNVLVTGQTSGSDGNAVYATVKYSKVVAPSVHLDFQKLDKQLVLSWANAGFSLQSAPAITDTFTNIPGATSPYTNSVAAPQGYFRLIAN